MYTANIRLEERNPFSSFFYLKKKSPDGHYDDFEVLLADDREKKSDEVKREAERREADRQNQHQQINITQKCREAFLFTL